MPGEAAAETAVTETATAVAAAAMAATGERSRAEVGPRTKGERKARVALVTVGQTPRTDMADDLRARLSPSIELVQYGALDGFTLGHVAAELAPAPGDKVLVSRMRDGAQATFSERLVLPFVQECIYQAERDGVDCTVLMCTGEFPPFDHSAPLIMPLPMFHSVAKNLAVGRPVALLIPEESQIPQARARWKADGIRIATACATPYGDPARIEEAASSFAGGNFAFVCLDCMGYTLAMRDAVRRVSGLPVLLPRTLVASVVSELYG